MRFIMLAVSYFGLPLWAAARSPLNAGVMEVAEQFGYLLSAQTVITVLFAIGAVVLDRCLSGQWIWQEDTVVVRRRSSAERQVAEEARIAAEEAILAAHQKRVEEELDAQYRAWLFHK